MRQEKIPIKFSLSFPLPDGKPDGNGVVYTKEAVRKALAEMPENLPIIDRTNGKSTVIGYTCGKPQKIGKFSNEKVFFEIEGIINAGGTECKASIDENVNITTVTDFKITAVGLCEN